MRVSPGPGTASQVTPSSSSAAATHRPVWPPSSAIAWTSAPSACAARAALSALPPATATTACGRWISPGVTASTTWVRSIDGEAATKAITR